jgi:hypothetical protein
VPELSAGTRNELPLEELRLAPLLPETPFGPAGPLIRILHPFPSRIVANSLEPASTTILGFIKEKINLFG